MSETKPTLFISYCQWDGNTYADDLEEELKDYFEVKRDKTKLIPNDDIYDFMAGIANEDYVIIVLTAEYVKSRNCMLEMAYLADQEDWTEKTMVLVIDEQLYSTDRKLEVLTYWKIRQRKENVFAQDTDVGKEIHEQDKEYLDLINKKLEGFLMGLSRRLNPSQIAIVNEMVRKLKNRPQTVNAYISQGEKCIMDFLKNNGAKSMREICEYSGYTKTATTRFIRNLIDKGMIQALGGGRQGTYKVLEEA